MLETAGVAAADTRYAFTDLGNSGGIGSRACDINDAVQVVGTSSPTGNAATTPFHTTAQR
jgi:hypothetical protein